MFGRDKKPEADAIEVILGPRASLNGVLRCDASIRIDGAVEGGKIETTANVILTETARVQSDITAKTVSIRGVYSGVMHADRVELLEGSQVYGSLNVNTFYMDEGVLLRAELNIQGAEAHSQLALPEQTNAGSIPVIRPANSTPG
ncbi:MAG: polymer-forming cytoskeletal protein [Caldilineaceae bacterium]|nr:polymer-forming cytoskeletal protein [Caldilineaceae bacterium]